MNGSPPPCSEAIFARGGVVGIITNIQGSWEIEKAMSRIGGQTDWHYAAGRAVVLTLSDPSVIRSIMEAHGFEFY